MLFLQRTIGNQAVESGRRGVRTPGQPLAPDVRAQMEAGFGRDLGDVRVHTDRAAAESASVIQAEAFTVGQDVAFGEGRYAPGTGEGRTLLAHEIAHTIQQREGTGPSPSNDPHGTHETSARTAADAVATGGASPGGLPSTGVGLSMQPIDEERARAVAEAEAVANRPVPDSEDEADTASPAPARPEVTTSLLNLDSRFKAEQWTDEHVYDPLRKSRERRAADPEEVERKKRRRDRTTRFFSKVRNDRLRDAYVSRLQRYFDEGAEENKHWDLETIEKIIDERAPNAPWRTEAREEAIQLSQATQLARQRQERFSRLPADQREALVKLDRRTAKWTDEEKALARDLLWQVFERRNQGESAAFAKKQVLAGLVDHYELWLREVDAANQAECRTRPRPQGFGQNLKRGLENAWGDACEPWFEHSHQHGYSELHNFDSWLRVTTRSESESPLDTVFYSVKEYRNLTNPEMQLARLRGQALIGIAAGGFGGIGARLQYKAPAGRPGSQPEAPAPLPGSASRRRPGAFAKRLRNLYLATKLTIDDVAPALGDIAGGALPGSRPVAAAVQTGPSVAATPEAPAVAAPAKPAGPMTRVPAAVDVEVEASFAEGASFQAGTAQQTGRVRTTGSGRQLRSLDEIPLTPAQHQAARIVHGQTMTGDHQTAWQNATNPRELNELAEVTRLWNLGTPQAQQQARDLARDIFNRHRGRYWAAVRRDPALRAVFEAAGMRFTGGNTTAPVYDLPDGTTIALTLEHTNRLADDPASATQGSNLQWVLGDENSVNLEFIRARDPFQRPPPQR